MADVHIRAVTFDDLDAWTDILNCPGVVAGTTQVPYRSVDQRREVLEQMLLSPNVHHLGADVDGRIVGELTLTQSAWPRSSHTATVGMAVHDEWQSHGIGKQLLAHAVQFAVDWLGVTRIELEVVDGNDPGRAMAESCGFEHEATRVAARLQEGRLVDVHIMAVVTDLPQTDATSTTSLHTQVTRPTPPPERKSPVLPNSVTIREMTRGDIDDAWRIFRDPRAVWGTMRLPFQTRETTENWFESSALSATDHWLAAEVDSIVVGTMSVHGGERPRVRHVGSIGMALRDDYQGRGIGTLMLQQAIDFAER